MRKETIKNLLIAIIGIFIILLFHYLFYITPRLVEMAAYRNSLSLGEPALQQAPTFLYGYNHIFNFVTYSIFLFILFYFVEKYKFEENISNNPFRKLPLIGAIFGFLLFLYIFHG
jgi:hypothetical protein